MSFDVNKLMQSFQQMPDIMNKVQDELAKMRVIGDAGAGMVTIEFNGKGEALHVEIQEEAYANGRKFLQELIVAALNDGANKREGAKIDALKSISGLEGVLDKI